MPEATEYVNTQLTNPFKVSFNTETQPQGPDLGTNGQTHIREVPRYPTALAVLVPHWGPFTGPEAM